MKEKKSIFRYLILIFLVILVMMPIGWLIISAFKSPDEIINNTFGLPKSVNFSNFSKLDIIPGFWVALKNSLVVAIICTFLVIVVTIPIGYIMSRFSFPNKELFERIIILFGYLFAPVVLAFPYFKIFNLLGIANSVLGIGILHFIFSLPFALMINRLIFNTLSLKYEEVAMLDKISLSTILIKIVLPSVRASFIALIILVFAISWKEFFFSFILSYTGENMTLPVLLSILYGGESINWELICALATVMILPSLVFIYILFKSNRNILFISPVKG